MVDVYDSHEQSERVKGWLRENGGAIVMGLVLAFGGLFGFKQWQVWDEGKAKQASAEYEILIELLAEDRIDDAMANYEVLRTEHAATAYSTLAAMHMAAARVDLNQVDLAISLLEQSLPKAEPAPVKVIIRERLARLFLDQGRLDEALATIDSAATNTGFESRFAELRGDVLRAQGDLPAALAAYESALEFSDTGVGYRPLLEMKITELAGATGVADDLPMDGVES